jgi:hypothetical protein
VQRQQGVIQDKVIYQLQAEITAVEVGQSC